MSEGGSMLVVEAAGGVLDVTLNRPEKRNALSRSLLGELRRVFSEFAGADGLRVAVLRGAGDKSFAAGGDLRDLAQVRTREDTRRMAEEAHGALDAIRGFPVPVGAALCEAVVGADKAFASAVCGRVAGCGRRATPRPG